MRVYDYSVDHTQPCYTFFSPEQEQPVVPSYEFLHEETTDYSNLYRKTFIPGKKKRKYKVPSHSHIKFIVSDPKEWTSFLKIKAEQAGYLLKDVYEMGVHKTRATNKQSGGQFTIHEDGISYNYSNERDQEALFNFIHYLRLNSSIRYIICTTNAQARAAYRKLLERAQIPPQNILYASYEDENEISPTLQPASKTYSRSSMPKPAARAKVW